MLDQIALTVELPKCVYATSEKVGNAALVIELSKKESRQKVSVSSEVLLGYGADENKRNNQGENRTLDLRCDNNTDVKATS